MSSRDFFGNWIVKNLLFAAVAVIALVLICSISLNLLTHHGQEIPVPDFTNMSVSQAEKEAHRCGIRIEVTDSVYVRKMDRGAVFSQVPKAGSGVKKGRRIQLTINSIEPKQVSMPDLVGLSMRQAKAELISRGLHLGRLIYQEDIATNNVLKQLYRGRPIAPGRNINSGSTIDLVVGLGEDSQTYVPDVIGMKYLRAVDAIHDNSLNIRSLRFDKSIREYGDSLDAIVYRQIPEASSDVPLPMGSDVTLYLSKDSK